MWRIEERGFFCPSSDMQTQNMWCPPRAWHFCRGREGGVGRGGADAIAECERWACDTLGRCCSPHKPSPELALYRAEKCTHQPQCCGVAWRRAADELPRQASNSAAAQQLKFSRKQQSARHCQSAACRPSWLLKGRGTVAGLLGSHLIGAACPRAPRGSPCPCREGCSDRGTLGSRLKEPEGASAAPPD